uniref:Uncharacterized protein n=1 Tax=Cacopsylla melanoneura TaxID=428564 RepID=A0A8D8QTI9_9HEMI
MFTWKSFRRRRCCSRWRQSNSMYIALLLILFYTWYCVRSAHEKSPPCTTELTEETYASDMHRFAYKVHGVLDKAHIRHFLCYNALWGQIRYRRIIPWQRELEICVVCNRQNLEGLEETFQNADIDIVYRARRAEYAVTADYLKGYVKLIVFQHDPVSQTYFRPGWMYRITPGETFPSYLLNGSLPLKPFGPGVMPVPLYDIEIQKYHFPDS